MKYFSGKVVLITGSSRGIGKVTALRFLKAGAKVVLNGRSFESLNETQMEFRQLGFDPLASVGDVNDPEFCNALVQRTVSHFGRLDILINNAGGGFRGRVDETSPRIFQEVVNANLMSAGYCTHAALPEIKKTKGSIVFISSLAGIRGLPNNGPYCVAKMGLTAFAETLRLELNNTGVHIGILYVGFTDYDEKKRIINADGTLVPISRRSHHTREQVAEIILQTIRKRKRIVYLTLPGKLLVFLNRFFPGLLEWILARSTKSKFMN
ncbi:SDR family oxidoreductase [Mariniradius sediminis]|uniref:SDR family oxidoreductase n=1 Tax=Mariniradius sediminis TaxID=2909237 RepID=A0ABS9BT43_9BACT|nr:SDR family oxidoreductase [Mariniradius sediminis]MCF1751217.1 SDR family oxidoreductase [Mariniradius sediminis]